MKRQVLASIAFALLLVIAGCTGGGGGTTTAPEPIQTTVDQTTAPGPSQTTTDSSPTIPSDVFPSGTSADGVDNATALLNAHNEAITKIDFSSKTNITLAKLSGNSTIRTIEQSQTFSDVDRQRAMVSLYSARGSNGTTTDSRTDAFVNQTLLVTRTTQDNETSYNVSSVSSFNSTIGYGSQIVGILSSASFKLVGTGQQGDRAFLRYNVTGLNQSLLPENRSFDQVSGTLVVDDRGMIRMLSLRYLIADDAGNVLLARGFSFTTSPRDVTIEKPAWLQTALREAANQ